MPNSDFNDTSVNSNNRRRPKTLIQAEICKFEPNFRIICPVAKVKRRFLHFDISGTVLALLTFYTVLRFNVLWEGIFYTQKVAKNFGITFGKFREILKKFYESLKRLYEVLRKYWKIWEKKRNKF